jgi:hypothetical protein
MKNESGTDGGGSGFLRAFQLFRKIIEIIVVILWLTITILMFIINSELWRSAFEICSMALLGISIFNAISMIGFGVLKRERFQTGHFIMLLALIVVAIIALALSLFVMGIRLR